MSRNVTHVLVLERLLETHLQKHLRVVQIASQTGVDLLSHPVCIPALQLFLDESADGTVSLGLTREVYLTLALFGLVGTSGE